MKAGWAYGFGLLGVLACAVVIPAHPAQSYKAELSPWAICDAASLSDKEALEYSLAPVAGASVQAGSAVTFSGHSGSPVTFAVASLPALLSSPDIDSGPGVLQPGTSSTYTFASTKATATPRTVYWTASFSSAGLAACTGQPPTTYTTSVRTLTVLPAPTTTRAPTPTATIPPVQVSISALGSFRLAHPTVSYRVHCTASCSGETYYEVSVLRRHAKAVRVPKLDLGPMPVSIIAASGGDDQFTHRYSGRSLRLLRSLLRNGGVVELQLSVKVTDAAGSVARGQKTASLR